MGSGYTGRTLADEFLQQRKTDERQSVSNLPFSPALTQNYTSQNLHVDSIRQAVHLDGRRCQEALTSAILNTKNTVR